MLVVTEFNAAITVNELGVSMSARRCSYFASISWSGRKRSGDNKMMPSQAPY